MEKNNREKYFEAWLLFLKGRNQIDPKALADFLAKTLKGALAPITRKRYTATVIINLYENGFLAGKTVKTFSGEPLEIVQEITLPILDKCLTSNYKKVKFTDFNQHAEPVEPVTEAPVVKKPRKTVKKKKAEKPEVVAEAPAAKKPRKAAPKKKPAPKAAQAKKPVARKPGPAKKLTPDPPEKGEVVKAKKAPGRKPGRKAAAMAPVVAGRRPAAKKLGLVGRETDLLRMGEGAFLYAIRQQEQIEEMERVIANYERMFEAVRQLFSREMEEIEELVVGLLE